MKLGEGFIEVRADRKPFEGDLKDLASQIRGGGGGASEVQRALRDALVGGAFLVGAKKAVDAASSLEQAVGGTSAVFGEAKDSVEDFARGAAESAGLSERAARELTSSLGGLLKGFGFTNTEAAELSVTLAKLGADLAATFGGTPEEAVQALGAALRGETDPLERFGIALNQTLVNQKAVELGLASSTSAVDQNAKAQATLALITERSADAQGQFAREADTAAGQTAIAAAKTENAAADMGENLLPIYTKLAETVGFVADAFGSLPEPAQTAVIAIAGIAALSGPVKTATDALGALATIARTKVASGLETAALQGLYLKDNLGKVALGAGALGAAFTAGALLLDSYQKSKARAAELEQAYTDILSEQTEGVEENTAAFAGKEILKGGLGEALREAGANVSVFTDAIQEDTEAVVLLNDKWNGLYDGATNIAKGLKNAGLEGTALGDELIRLADSGALSDDQLRTLVNRLNDQAEGYRSGAREAENKATADEEAGVKAEEAAPKVEGLADALSLNDQAAKDAKESMDLFREAVERALRPLDFEEAVDAQAQALADLAEDIAGRAQAVNDARQRLADLQAGRADSEISDARAIADAEERLAEARARVADTADERAAKTRAIADAEEALARAREDAGDGGKAARDVAEAQRELDEAIANNTTSLEGNTEAARNNREAIREIVDRSVDVIEAAREQEKSLDELRYIRGLEIQSMRDQLEQMGFNREEIDRYVDVIEDIPLTKSTTLTVETATAEAQLKEAMRRFQTFLNQNPLSIDAAIAEKFAFGPRESVTGHAAGGDVMDGLFRVHEGELMRKQGSSVEVIAGAPTPLRFDGVGEDLLLAVQEQNELLRRIAFGGGSIDGQRAAALELV